MDQSVIFSTAVTVCAGLTILFARFIYLEATAKAYCNCGHEFNEHWVFPNGMKARSFGIDYEHEQCKLCGCHGYKKNEKDLRNSKSPRFFP